MFTDMVGYSALAGRDEELCLELLEEHRLVIRRTYLSYGGKEIKTIGDAFFIEFASVVEAVRCAVEIQTALFERNLAVPDERRVQIRIGIHLGDIVDSEDDRYGNEINIAARIEPLARPGGISVTQQVVDQITRKLDLPVRRLGKLKLKNIESPPEVFRIILPWERTTPPLKALRNLIPRGTTLESRLLTLQLLASLAALTWVFSQLLHPQAKPVDLPLRSPALAKPSQQTLPASWQYALGSEETPTTEWKPFDIVHTAQYADVLEGDYLLKLQFTPDHSFRHPAMVLGLVSEVHRAYLNGKFVGGSQHFSDLAAYSFSTDLVQESKTNTLLIKAHSRHTLTPGLYLLPNVAPSIGEYEDISQIVETDEVHFHVLRSVYFAISLMIACASLAYCGSRKTPRKYLYYSLFLFLGSLCLAYYNMYVTSELDYQSIRFIKVLAFGLSSFALCSVDFHLRGKKRLERVNNFSGLVAMGVAAIVLLDHGLLPSQFVHRYNFSLLAISAYSVVWLSVLTWRAVFRKLVSRDPYLLLAFGATITLLAYASLIGPTLISSAHQEQIKNVAIVYPFVFAMLVFSNGLADYIRKSRVVTYKRKKDDLILSISTLSAECIDAPETITMIQKKLTDFLEASRSTIYLAEMENIPGGETYLKATYIHGPHGIKSKIQKVVRPGSGIIGYCMAHRTAVWVEDIRKDPRFQTELSRRLDNSSSYKTGSFIVVPLLIGSELLGVITIADRGDGRPFTRTDFCVMHLVAKDLAFILGNSRTGQKGSAVGAEPLKNAS
jgi:adenylate cyclase